MKIEESEGGHEKNNSKSGMKKLSEIPMEYKFEIIWWIIFALIFILGLILPESNFLELLYLFHKKSTYSIVLFFILWELIYLVQSRIRQKPLIDAINHILISLFFFFIIFGLNLLVYEKVVGSKLTTIKILELKDGDKLSIPAVKIFIRNVKVPIYPIVETTQGTLWIQAKRLVPYNQFTYTFIEEVRLGGGYIIPGESFKIFAIGTKEDLNIGVIERTPPDSIASNTVTVTMIE